MQLKHINNLNNDNTIKLGLLYLLFLTSLNIYSQNSFLKEIDFTKQGLYWFDLDDKNRVTQINSADLINEPNFKSLLNFINLNAE